MEGFSQNSGDLFSDIYNQISSKFEIQRLYNKYSQDSEQRLKEIIKEKYSNIKSNTEKLQKCISEYQTIINKINLKAPIEIQQIILSLIDQIDFFEKPQKDINNIEFEKFNHPNQKYKFRVKLQTNSQSNSFLLVGIIQEQDKGNKQLFNGICYNERGDKMTINKVVKGNNVFEGYKANIDKEIEVRIHLAQKMIKVSNYPYYENVEELENKQLILENSQYRFAVELYYPAHKIIITHLSTVNVFDLKM
ncbi:hypothetical protein ABPG72_014507 [Tetrahymena utriculariae]